MLPASVSFFIGGVVLTAMFFYWLIEALHETPIAYVFDFHGLLLATLALSMFGLSRLFSENKTE